jgi:hypothetical protein
MHDIPLHFYKEELLFIYIYIYSLKIKGPDIPLHFDDDVPSY